VKGKEKREVRSEALADAKRRAGRPTRQKTARDNPGTMGGEKKKKGGKERPIGKRRV